MDRSEYVQINISEISQEFVDEYNLHELAKDGLTYFEITKGVYGLPQSGILYNTQLPGNLAKRGTLSAQQLQACGATSGDPYFFA